MTTTGCPSCRCVDIARTGDAVRDGVPGGRCECRHCGRRFWAASDGSRVVAVPDLVVWPDRTCPMCNSSKIRRVKTAKRVVYHLCISCGYRFKAKRPRGGGDVQG